MKRIAMQVRASGGALNKKMIAALGCVLFAQWANSSPASAASAGDNASLRSLKEFRTFSPPLLPGTPPSADPRDFNGVYMLNPVAQVMAPTHGGDQADGMAIPPFTAYGAGIFWKRIERFNAGKQIPEPSVMCEPSWKTRTSSQIQITQASDVMTMLYAELHVVRLIHMNSAHPKNPKPSYLGHSTGRWEGNTLVVDTIGFNDRGWFDFAGTPQSPTTHLVERISKDADGSVRDAMTFTDPRLFRHAFTTVEMYRRTPADDSVIDEQICEENERNFGLETTSK